jgi:predicted TIM-barrel fold metal-dependent hydrolase
MRTISVLVVVTLSLLVGCRQEANGTAPKRKRAPEKPLILPMDASKYEAEIAHLKERLQTSEAREAKWPIINTHEHLLKARHLPNYLQAARRIGVAQTVIVTSTRFTLYGKGEKTYPSMAKNWLNVRKAMRDYPGEIIAFATVDPDDPDKLAHLKQMVAEGAVGVKLYSGHSNLYDKPLNDPSMDEIYKYLEETQLPMNWHINLGKFWKDFEDVMTRYPKLNVMIPHYGVAFWRYQRLENLSRLMRKFPTVLVDTSLGTRDILIDGMYVMAKDEPYAAFEKFFDEFQDRIVYGSDSVITGNKEKTASWYYSVLAATMDHLEEETFTFPLAEAYSTYFKKGRDPTGRIKGFHLSDAVLEKIYVTNAKTWLEKYKPLPPAPKHSELTPVEPPAAPAEKAADPPLPAQPEGAKSGGDQKK